MKRKKILAYAFVLLVLILSTLVAGKILKFRSQSNVTFTRASLVTYASACSNYFAVYGEWPKSLDDLFNNKSNISFIYTTTPKLDAWGNVMEYGPYDPVKGFASIKSLGSDGKPGGSGVKADLEVHFSTNAAPVIFPPWK
jgi:hypothetical protein